VPKKKRKEIIRGFAVDAELDKLIKAGAKLECSKTGKPSISNFLRAAIEKYFEEVF